MNVSEITRVKSYLSIWIFVIVAIVLMVLTVGVWTMWSKAFDDDRGHKKGKQNIIDGLSRA